MSAETLERAWALLFPAGAPRAGTSIRLGSGEPLLAESLLKRLARKVAAAGDARPQVFLTTNGTLLGAPTRDWLVRSGWHVKVSLDGPADVHDRWRTTPAGAPTFASVSHALRELARRMPERLSVTAVLCRRTDPARVFRAIAALGVRRIELVPAAHVDPDVQPDEADLERYRAFVADWVEAQVELVEQPDAPLLVKVVNGVRRVMGYDLARVTCGAGRSFLAVGPAGDLYPCFRFVGLERYRLGDLRGGLDAGALERFRSGPGRPYEERAPCADCRAAPLCCGPCFACAELFGDGDGRHSALHCGFVEADARGAAQLVERLRARDPELLLRFLPEASALLSARV